MLLGETTTARQSTRLTNWIPSAEISSISLTDITTMIAIYQ
jgi:hypothetical protein